LRIQVSFAKEPYKRDDIQNGYIVCLSLLRKESQKALSHLQKVEILKSESSGSFACTESGNSEKIKADDRCVLSLDLHDAEKPYAGKL